MTADAIKWPRLKVALVVVIIFAPFIVAYALYYGSGWRPQGQVNHGRLISPARPLPKLDLVTPSGQPAPANALRGLWTILYVGPSQCAERCRKTLYYARQAHTALNHKAYRVRGVYIALDSQHLGALQALVAKKHRGLNLYLAKDGSVAVLTKFLRAAGVAASQPGNLYLIDPLGNWMMAYPANQAPATQVKGMLEDLRRLLRISHIG